MWIEAAVEGGEVAAEGEQFVELAKDLVLLHDVAALLAGEAIEGAVVALGDADVGVVDDAHDHVRAGVGCVKAAADQHGERAELGVGGVLPEPAGLVDRDAATCGELLVDAVEGGLCGDHRIYCKEDADGGAAHCSRDG